MDEVDSPEVAQEPSGDSQQPSGQELSKKPKSDPTQRLNGMMALVGKRTQERDEARAETERLRQQLDHSVTGGAPQLVQQQQQPQQQLQAVVTDDDEPEPTGWVDTNNPSREQASLGAST